MTDFIKRNSKKADCSFCEAKETDCVSPRLLADYFLPLINLYTPVTKKGGRSITYFLRKDWALFKKLRNDHALAMLSYMFPGEDYSKKKFHNKNIFKSAKLIIQWQEFREELKYENRFFPQKRPDMGSLYNLFRYLIFKIKRDHVLYRCRLCNEKTPFTIKDMGKPPLGCSRNGRANPQGICYLYLASDEATALAEIRPHVGDMVSVASFNVSEDLTLVDLRDPRNTVSPFLFEESELAQMLHKLEYLCKLGKELSQPIVPSEMNLEYLPTQYLCESIKLQGFDGVLYKSSVGKGHNLVVFNDKKLAAAGLRHFKIKKTIYKSAEIKKAT